jgi:glycosyltransferase involved in cell wall biosynthesis
MKVLYVDAVGPFGGASRSLFEAVQALTAGPVRAYFVMQQGSAQDFYGKVAQDVIAVRGLTRLDNTRFSHYRGVRWLVPLREIFHFPYTLVALWRAKQRWGQVDLIHVNEVIDIIPGLIAKALFNAPMVVHVRSLQWTNRRALRTRWVNHHLKSSAAAVIAINENTRASLPDDLHVEVIQNSFTPKKASHPEPALLAQLKALRPASLKVGFVGNLHASKGLFELLEAMHILRSEGHDVECLVVGSVTIPDRGLKAWMLSRAGLAQNIEAEVQSKVVSYGIADSFHLLGHTNDIQTVYERLDVIAFPSYYDAPGRPVFEAAFSGVPSIVCVDKPRPDTLIPRQTGLSVPPKDPAALALAILHFANDRGEVRRMGLNARALAVENFVPATNARRLLAVYERVLGRVAATEQPTI